MSLNGLRTALAEDKSFERVRLYASRPAGERSEDLQIGAPPGLRAALLAEMVEGQDSGVVLAVTATGRETEDLATAVRCYLRAESIEEFPSWETLPHERLSPRSDTVGRRLSVLRRLKYEGDCSRTQVCRCATVGWRLPS